MILRPDFPKIFAALGAEKNRTSLDEIMAQRRFDRAKVERLAEDLVQVGLAKRPSKTRNVIPLALALEAVELQTSDFLKKDFFRSLEKAKSRFTKQADAESDSGDTIAEICISFTNNKN